MKFTKDLSKKVLSAMFLLGASIIVKAAEPNFKLKNNLRQPIWYGVASTEGALNRRAFEKKLELLASASEAIGSVDNVNKRVFLLIMGSPEASHGIMYELPQNKALWVVIAKDARGNITLAPQKRPLIVSKTKRLLWDKNVTDADIGEKPFYLHRYRVH